MKKFTIFLLLICCAVAQGEMVNRYSFTDGDTVADVCDPCPADNPDDTDGDGVCDSADVCPGSDDTVDTDGDSRRDGADRDSDNDGLTDGGSASWNLVSRNGQEVVSGIYLYVVQSDDGAFEDFIGKFVVVR